MTAHACKPQSQVVGRAKSLTSVAGAPLKTGPVQVALSLSGSSSPLASLRSVFEVLAASSSLRERIAKLFPDLVRPEGGSGISNLFLDIGDLIVCESILCSADGTGDLRISVNPSERYVELVAAIGRDGDVSFDLDVHRWPILSVGGDTPTVAEGEGAEHALPGGDKP